MNRLQLILIALIATNAATFAVTYSYQPEPEYYTRFVPVCEPMPAKLEAPHAVTMKELLKIQHKKGN